MVLQMGARWDGLTTSTKSPNQWSEGPAPQYYWYALQRADCFTYSNRICHGNPSLGGASCRVDHTWAGWAPPRSPLNVMHRVVFVGGGAGELPLTGSDLPSHWFVWKLRGDGKGRERGKGRVGETTCLTSPLTGFCLKYQPGNAELLKLAW